MFLLALILVLSFAVFATALLKPVNRIAALLGWYLFGTANLVLVGEIAGIAGFLNNKFFFLIAHLVLFLIVLGVWMKVSKPPLWVAFRGNKVALGDWGVSLRKDFSLWLLGTGVALTYLVNAVLVFHVPPNNNDSMASHLARVGYWLQHGSFRPWLTPNILQLVYPINAQIQILWTILFAGNDRFVGYIQFLAVPVSMLAIFGLARLLGWKRKPALFAALIWGTLPQILLQSTSAQNDLAVNSLFIASVYLLYLGLQVKNTGALMLSGLALGLALGTKQSIFYMLPGLGFVLGYFLIRAWRDTFRSILSWFTYALISFVLLGSFMYVSNFFRYQNPFGQAELVGETVGVEDFKLYDQLVLKTSRWAYQFLDPIGLPYPVNGYFTRGKAKVAGFIFDLWQIPAESEQGILNYPGNQFVMTKHPLVQEDVAWFGPLGYLFILPVAIYQGLVALRKKNAHMIGLSALAISLFLGVLLLNAGWTKNQGRYFVLAVSCAAPFFAVVYKKGRWNAVYRGFIVVMALIVMATVTLNNVAKPLVGENAVWKLDRRDMQTLQTKYLRGLLRMVDNNVPEDATLGILSMGSAREYPFFGEHFTRKLIPIYPVSRFSDPQWLQENGVEYILFENEKFQTMGIPAHLAEIGHRANYVLLKNTLPVNP